jgi:hypothetical protein
MLTKVKTFFDQLYFGFYCYGKNYYDNEFSKYYGESLLLICIMVIIIPVVTIFVELIEPMINSLNNKFFHLNNLSNIIFILFFIFCILINTFYLHYKNRNSKIIEKYKELDGKSIKKIKQRSGYFAVFSFVWFFIGAIILFIYSQIKLYNL